MKKISILHENLQSMKANDYYRDVIAQPVTNRKVCYFIVLYYVCKFLNRNVLYSELLHLSSIDLVCSQRNGSSGRGRAGISRAAASRSVGYERSHSFTNDPESGKLRTNYAGYTIYKWSMLFMLRVKSKNHNIATNVLAAFASRASNPLITFVTNVHPLENH